LASVKTMEDLLKLGSSAAVGFKKGEAVKGKISVIKNKSIFIDIGGKTDAVVLGKEFEFVKDYVSDLKIGDEIEVQVKSPENDKGQILVSIRGAASGYGWSYFTEKEKSGGEITVFGKELNRGGVVVTAPFGFYGFIPGSQIGSEIVNKLRESGLCLMELFIVDINPPESIDKAREERGRLSAEQNAKLDATKIQYEIVKEQNKNLIESKIGEAIALRTQRIGEAKALRTQKLGEAKALRVQRTGEAKALLIQSKGIIEAILEENTGSGGSISEQELFNILSKYPAVAEVLGDKAKFFFQGGGDGLNIVSQIIAALDSSKDG